MVPTCFEAASKKHLVENKRSKLKDRKKSSGFLEFGLLTQRATL